MTPSIRYEYSDGSANRYIITSTQVEYIPVKPEESSTGTYSGGDPKMVLINQEQFNKISSLFEKALVASSDHISDRMKTSGLIVKTEGSKQTTCILKPKSKLITEIDEMLKHIITK